MLQVHIHQRLIVIVALVSLLASMFAAAPVLAQSSRAKMPATAPFLSQYFTYTASASNTNGYITTLNYPGTPLDPTSGLDGHPEWAVQVSQLWTSTYDTHPLGVWYNPFAGHWTVFNEDLAAMPLGTSFDVKYGPVGDAPSMETIQTTASASNTTSDWTLIDNALTNGNPQAKVLVSQNWTGTYNPHEIGVWYTGSKWAIFNEDGTAMPFSASFNVEIHTTPLFDDLIQTVQPANILAKYISIIDNPNYNGEPGLNLRVTQVWNVQGTCGCVYDSHPVGVWYDGSLQKWTVFTVDRASLPIGAAFYITNP